MAPKAAPADDAADETKTETPLPLITPIPLDPVLAFQEALELERQIESRLRKLSFVISTGESAFQQIQKEHQSLRNPQKACVSRMEANTRVRKGRQKTENHLSYLLTPRRTLGGHLSSTLYPNRETRLPHKEIPVYDRTVGQTWPEMGARFHLTSQFKRELETEMRGGKDDDLELPEASYSTPLRASAQKKLNCFGELRGGDEDMKRDRFEHQANVQEDLEALRRLPVQAAIEATASLLKDLKSQRTLLQALAQDKVTLGFPSYPGPRIRPPPEFGQAVRTVLSDHRRNREALVRASNAVKAAILQCKVCAEDKGDCLDKMAQIQRRSRTAYEIKTGLESQLAKEAQQNEKISKVLKKFKYTAADFEAIPAKLREMLSDLGNLEKALAKSDAPASLQSPDEALRYTIELEETATEQWATNFNIVKDMQKEGARALHGSLMPLDSWETKASPEGKYAQFSRYQF